MNRGSPAAHPLHGVRPPPAPSTWSPVEPCSPEQPGQQGLSPQGEKGNDVLTLLSTHDAFGPALHLEDVLHRSRRCRTIVPRCRIGMCHCRCPCPWLSSLWCPRCDHGSICGAPQSSIWQMPFGLACFTVEMMHTGASHNDDYIIFIFFELLRVFSWSVCLFHLYSCNGPICLIGSSLLLFYCCNTPIFLKNLNQI